MHNPPPETPEPDPLQDERRRQQLHRMAMVGTLAAGLGHDLRNLLMPVMLRLDVLAATKDLPPAARDDVVSIQASVARLQRLAAGLRLLASDPFDHRNEVQQLHLASWWLEVAPLVVDALAPGTRVTTDLSEELPTLGVPPGVLAQVVMNLVMNARRALNGVESPAMSFVGTVNGHGTVQLTVRDNGVGMDEDVRQRCFEPFFTTRPREYATGLGLSTGRSLLQRYGGDLRLNEPDGEAGVAFELTLPVRSHAASRATGGDTVTLDRGASAGVGVRVTLRDPRHRTVTLLMLSQRGLKPWSAAESDAAIAAPGTIICDGDAVTSLLAELQTQGVRDRTRVIAVGTPPESEHASGVTWVAPTRLGTLAELLD